MKRSILATILLATFLLYACAPETSTAPTLTPTKSISAPTLAASQTPFVRTSDEIYLNTPLPGQIDMTAAALPVDGNLPPVVIGISETGGNAQLVQLALSDGSLIEADLYEQGVDRVPGVLIVGDDKSQWLSMSEALMSGGHTVLVIDNLPQQALVNDVVSGIESLANIGSVDPGNIIVMGGDTFAESVFVACASAAICDAGILINPQGQEEMNNWFGSFLPRSVLMVYSENDPNSSSIVTLTQQTLGDAVTAIGYIGELPFASVIQNADVINSILAWMANV